MKQLLLILLAGMFLVEVAGQPLLNTDNEYRKPLDSALAQVARKFGVKILYPPQLTRGLEVPYADWRMRSDAEKSIINLLAPVNLGYRKADSNSFQIRAFEYYRRSVPESKEQLAEFATRYHDVA